MLCKYCESLDLDAASDTDLGTLHHESFADLVASADNGCELCVWIAGDTKRIGSGDIKDYSKCGRVRCSYNDVSLLLEWTVERPPKQGRFFRVAWLPICTTKDDPISEIVHCRPVSCDARSEKLSAQIDAWISACSSEHSSCHPRGRLRLPTRVIDVGDSGTSPSLFISNGQYDEWVALSYCWGKKLPLRTMSHNLEDFRKQLPFEMLPPLFQDAITFVRRLGHRYLWIDALCIIQDSEKDWITESATMDDVFHSATLTIAAEAAKDSSVGLFDSMEKERHPLSVSIPAYSQRSGVRGHVSGGIDSESRMGPLSKRAWTLQEELLSPCVIRFAEQQVWWQCREALRSEAYPDSLSRSPDRQEWSTKYGAKLTSKLNRVLFKLDRRDNLSRLLESWYTTVNFYCAREITYVKDVFPAISGMASQYRKNGLQDYRAGLWLDDMHQGLLWTTVFVGCRNRTPYVAPSWSWASVEGKFRGPESVQYEQYLISQICVSPLECVARIKSVNVTLLSEDPFGQIKAANLVMMGPSKEICRNDILSQFLDNKDIWDVRCGCYGGLEHPLEQNETILHWSLRKTALCNVWTVEKFTGESRRPQHPCLLLHVVSHQEKERPRYAFCLILETVPDEEDEGQEQDESRDTKDHSKQPKTKQAGETNAQGKPRNTRARERAVRYRRIGLAMLQETVPTSTIWSDRTVTII